MTNFLKNLFNRKEKAQDGKFLENIEIKSDETKYHSVNVHVINVEKYNEHDMKVFDTIKALYNYGDMCLIYEKDLKDPVALYQYKINGWEKI